MSNEDIKTQVEATLKAEFAEYHEHQGCGDECSAKFTEAQHIESATTQILSLINEARVEKHEQLRQILIDNNCPEVGDAIIDDICRLFGYRETDE